jgi:hypothetical protein
VCRSPLIAAIVLSVKLEPGKTYAVLLNSESGDAARLDFRDEEVMVDATM